MKACNSPWLLLAILASAGAEPEHPYEKGQRVECYWQTKDGRSDKTGEGLIEDISKPVLAGGETILDIRFEDDEQIYNIPVEYVVRIISTSAETGYSGRKTGGPTAAEAGEGPTYLKTVDDVKSFSRVRLGDDDAAVQRSRIVVGVFRKHKMKAFRTFVRVGAQLAEENSGITWGYTFDPEAWELYKLEEGTKRAIMMHRNFLEEDCSTIEPWKDKPYVPYEGKVTRDGLAHWALSRSLCGLTRMDYIGEKTGMTRLNMLLGQNTAPHPVLIFHDQEDLPEETVKDLITIAKPYTGAFALVEATWDEQKQKAFQGIPEEAKRSIEQNGFAAVVSGQQLNEKIETLSERLYVQPFHPAEFDEFLLGVLAKVTGKEEL